ncbi:hypothetical protein BHM03_00036149 [Ensete ventricosum]|nr:hypothetical protein BHM03_00036149 [Ensete ventricosum]
MVSRKNATVINFAQSRVSIDFSFTVSKIQKTYKIYYLYLPKKKKSNTVGVE